MTDAFKPAFVDLQTGPVVILSRDHYETLVRDADRGRARAGKDGGRSGGAAEDAADIALADRRMTDWEAAGRPGVPLPVLRMVRAGDSYLRAFRKHRGLTQAALAKAVVIGQGYLSDLESGRKQPSGTTAAALAKALDMHVRYLLEAPAVGTTARSGS